jgi:hypothetical protein
LPLCLSTHIAAIELQELLDPIGSENQRVSDCLGKFAALIDSDPDAAFAAVQNARVPSGLKAKLYGMIRTSRTRLAAKASGNRHTHQMHKHMMSEASRRAHQDKLALASGNASNTQHGSMLHGNAASFASAAAALMAEASGGAGNDLDTGESAMSGHGMGGAKR